MIRSFLFIPGDSERKLAKGPATGADALILDLEDAVTPENREPARALVREYLQAHPQREPQQIWVRINPLSAPSDLALTDLAHVMPGAPDGIVLPKPDDAAAALALDHHCAALEAREGLPIGATRILAVATETAASLFNLHTYAGVTPRLYGLTWGAEDLSAALHAIDNRTPSGDYDGPYLLARNLTLLAARAAGVEPVDGLYSDFRDTDALRAEAAQARRSGFSGKIAIHPGQVPVINDAFTPTDEEVAHAQRVVDAFAAAPGAGALGLHGKMLDRPHLTQAQRTLETARRYGGARPS